MSPGSRSSRGAMTLTPAPSGAKAFSIANRTSASWRRKNVSSSARGFEHSADAPKSWSSTPRPSGLCHGGREDDQLDGVVDAAEQSLVAFVA